MIKPNWNVFKAKFSDNPQEYFEWFVYLLFCKQFNKPHGIFRYKNQSAIETNPIAVDGEMIGWQAKFYEDTLSKHKNDLLEMLEKAKGDYSSITKLIVYTNSEWGQGRSGSSDTRAKIDVEKKAKELGIDIVWNTASFFESPFVSIDQKIISSYFFSENPLIYLRPEKGWFPYENWSNPSQGVDEEYFISNETVIFNDKDEKRTLLDGLSEVRNKLSEEQSAVRLIGLSGVGKTRFVQVVFDDRIGENPLDPSIVCYTDMSREPDPSPLVMAESLVEIGERVVLIVDNCSPDLHRKLVETVTREGSLVSLLTVEYDVKDDLPEETAVFKLEPNSLDVIEKIIENRFPHISRVDMRLIAEFSGGNARVAIALASTVGCSESLSGLRDSELFKRLFQQRHDPNDNLMKSAEVLSLVYSFNGKKVNENSELSFLAKLVGKEVRELYRDVQELKKRDLVQERGEWRAVLPQAIANRLAKQALEFIPIQEIVESFLYSSNERLIRSFAHRLSFLHDSKETKEIAEEWLDEDGWIGKVDCDFNDLGRDIFRYMAPVVPNKALECMERAAISRDEEFLDPSKNSEAIEFVHLLRHIAYEAEYFERAGDLILRFVFFEKKNDKHNKLEGILKSLFWFVLSGTHAPLELRREFIKKLLDSDDEIKQDIGFVLLESTLETDHFTPHYSFDFGARSRDFGWQPKTVSDRSSWYQVFIEISMDIALSKHRLSKSARKLLADKFRGLWNSSVNFDLLEEMAQQLNEQDPWIEGYLAVKKAIRFDKDRYRPEVLEKILHIEKCLKPVNLYSKALVYITHGRYRSDDCYHFEDGRARRKCEKRLQKEALEIGKKLGRNKKIFISLLPQIVTSDNYMLQILIQGILETYPDRKEFWSLVYKQYENTPKKKWRLRAVDVILRYFYEHDPEYFSEIMDYLLEDKTFADVFPLLQIPLLDENGLERLHHSLNLQYAPLEYYKKLADGRVHETMDDHQLSNLLKHMLCFDKDLYVVIEILTMRFHGKTKEKHSPEIIEFGFDVLKRYRFEEDHSSDNRDYDLETIAKTCFENNNDPMKAKEICNTYLTVTKDALGSAIFPGLKKTLAHYQPLIFLDCMLKMDQDRKSFGLISDRYKGLYSAFSEIKDEIILEWCNDDPDCKIPFMLAYINPFDDDKNIKPIVYALLRQSGNSEGNLEILLDAVTPSSWMGSRANRYERTLLFLEKLEQSDIGKIGTWAKEKYKEYERKIEDIKEQEEQEDRLEFERFE